jgi:hypothetical protein
VEVTLEVEISEEIILAWASSQTRGRTNVTHSLLFMSNSKLAALKSCIGLFLLRLLIYFHSITGRITMRIPFSCSLIINSASSILDWFLLGTGEIFPFCLTYGPETHKSSSLYISSLEACILYNLVSL